LDVAQAQIFAFESTTASFARLEILDTWGSDSFGATFYEAAFGVAPIPLPASIWLMGSCLAGLVATTRRRKNCAQSM
jgi:hypothetical protein